jgi:hypothetical protein
MHEATENKNTTTFFLLLPILIQINCLTKYCIDKNIVIPIPIGENPFECKHVAIYQGLKNETKSNGTKRYDR